MTATRAFMLAASTAEDLLRAGEGSLGRGSVLTMPADAAALCVVRVWSCPRTAGYLRCGPDRRRG